MQRLKLLSGCFLKYFSELLPLWRKRTKLIIRSLAFLVCNGRLRKLLIVILLGVWGFSCFAADTKTTKPYLGSIQKSFTEPARTHLENTYVINMPIAGQLARVKIREGSKVKKGELLAIMEQEPLKQAVNKAKAHLHTVKSQLDFQQKTVKRYQKLNMKGFVKKAELDEALAKEEILQAEFNEAVADIAISEYNLEQSFLRSPVNGVILNRYVQGGEWVRAGTPLLRVGDLQKLEVICDVLTQEAQELKIGDPVVLSSIGTRVILHGNVKQIYPAGFTKKSSLGVDEQRVNVIITIKDHRKAKLGLDYRLQARFLVGARKNNALIVPRFSVLQDVEGNHYVFVVKSNKIYKRIVKLGILTDEKVSVLEGLSTKDLIVDQPTADMKDGMRL